MDTTEMRAHMARETPCRKCCIVFGSLFHAAMVAGVATVWFFWWINVRDIQNATETICENETQQSRAICENDDIIVYDMYFLTDIKDPLKWTDYSQAIDYYNDLEQDCDDECMD